MPRKLETNRQEIIRQVTAQGGRFVVEVGESMDARVQAHYLGTYPYGPCDSRELKV